MGDFFSGGAQRLPAVRRGELGIGRGESCAFLLPPQAAVFMVK